MSTETDDKSEDGESDDGLSTAEFNPGISGEKPDDELSAHKPEMKRADKLISGEDHNAEPEDVLPSGDQLAGRLIGDAQATVTSSRDSHGDAVENQEHIANGWTWYLRGMGILDDDEEITGGDVGRMMAILKMSRTAVGTYDVDSDRDIAGYAGIAAACEVVRGNATVDDLEEHA